MFGVVQWVAVQNEQQGVYRIVKCLMGTVWCLWGGVIWVSIQAIQRVCE